MASIQNLYTQSRSLQAYTQALQVTGRNIASSADPNYTRQEVTLQPSLAGANHGRMLGSSVNAAFKDTRDQLLEGQIWREQSGLAYDKESLSHLGQLELALFAGTEGPVELGADGGDYVSNGLLRAINDFYDAWADLEAQPNDHAARQAVHDRAETMIDRFRGDADSLANLRSTVGHAAETTVDKVNSLVSQVADLQQQIARLPASQNGIRSELTSLRDQTLSQLSQHIRFDWQPNAASPLESSLSVRLADGSNANLLTGGSVNDRLQLDEAGRLALEENGGAVALNGGTLSAQMRFLESDLPQWENQWNLIASEVVRVTNSVYNPGAEEGQNFFDPSFTTANRLRLEIASASDIRAGSDGSGNDIASTMGRLMDADLGEDFGSALNASFKDVLLDRQNTLARRINTIGTKASGQEKVVAFLEQEKATRSGVDLDREVTQLLQFQRSFQATSRVLRALDESLQTFLSDIA